MACLRRLIQLDPGVRDGRVSHPQPISWHETKLPPHRGWTIADIVLLIGFGDPEGLQQLNISHLSAMWILLPNQSCRNFVLGWNLDQWCSGIQRRVSSGKSAKSAFLNLFRSVANSTKRHGGYHVVLVRAEQDWHEHCKVWFFWRETLDKCINNTLQIISFRGHLSGFANIWLLLALNVKCRLYTISLPCRFVWTFALS